MSRMPRNGLDDFLNCTKGQAGVGYIGGIRRSSQRDRCRSCSNGQWEQNGVGREACDASLKDNTARYGYQNKVETISHQVHPHRFL